MIWPFSKPRKPMVFDLIPHTGMVPIQLGAKRDNVMAVMKALGHVPSAVQDTAEHLRNLGVEPPASSAGGSHYFIENCLQVEFDGNHRATFIGLAPHRGVELRYQGQDILTRPADEVFQILAGNEASPAPAFNPNEVLFSDQILTLWEADPQYDPHGERYPVWGQIGIGGKAYLE